jgi:hypothetical protein
MDRAGILRKRELLAVWLECAKGLSFDDEFDERG